MEIVSTYLSACADLLRSAAGQRRLLVALAKRDLSDEYVEHRLSLWWTLIVPLFSIGVYLFVFSTIFPARVQAPPNHRTDAIVYLLSGIIPWVALAQALGRATQSIVSNSNIVKQMAFPLELLPLKTLASPATFLGVSLSVVVVYSGWISGGSILPVYLWGIPLLLLLSFVTFAGLALLLSTVQVFLRDTKEFVGMFFSIGLFLHPILYPPDAIPESVRWILYASPFSQFIFCWQDILFFGGIVRPWAWFAAFAFAVATFIAGARLFMGAKTRFGDFL
jgi:lipopolysaccharide transport system permease protein